MEPAATVVTFAPGIDAQTFYSITSTKIIVAVPMGAETGPVSVTVDGRGSNEVPFTVVPGFASLVDPGFIVTEGDAIFPINQVLVRLAFGEGLSVAQDLAAGVGAQVVGYLPASNSFLFEFSPAPATVADLRALMAQLKADPRVMAAIRNVGGEAQAVDTDIRRFTDRSLVWAYDRIQAQGAWNLLKSKTLNVVKIAVIDTGFAFNPLHRDFQNLTGGGATVDYVPIGILGIAEDHGTAVAGIIGANNDPTVDTDPDPIHRDMNGILSGANVPFKLKVFGSGVPILQIGRAPAILLFPKLFAIGEAQKDGAQVVNMSYIIRKSLDEEEFTEVRNQYALTFALTSDILFVSSAGNDNGPASNAAPAGVDGFIHIPNIFPFGEVTLQINNNLTVGGTNADDQRWPNSNHGPEVDLSAPAEDVYTLHVAFVVREDGSIGDAPDAHQLFDGTSAATPQVAATAALLLSIDPNFSIIRLRSLLVDNGTPITTDKFIGDRRLNVCRSVAAALRDNPDKACAGDVFVTAIDAVVIPPEDGQFFANSERGVSAWTFIGPRVVTDAFSASAPTVSPDGTQFARFERGAESRLVVRRLPDGTAHKTLPLAGSFLSWLPDGLIFFQHRRGEDQCAFSKLNPVTEVSQLIASRRFCRADLSPALTPDGGLIAYTGSIDTDVPLFVMQSVIVVNAQTGAQAPLLPPGQPCTVNGVPILKCYLNTAITGEQGVSWAPDGKDLAVGGAIDADTDGDGRIDRRIAIGLLLINRGSGQVTNLRPQGANELGVPYAYFSPDGQSLLYEVLGRLKRINRAGAEQDLGQGRLVPNLTGVIDLRTRLLSPWSPKGTMFLFEDNDVLHASTADGMTRVQLSPSPLGPLRRVNILDVQWVPSSAR